MCFKTATGLLLEKAEGIRNIFVRSWKPNFFTDSKKRIASIPFIRNLIEYTKGESDPDYLKLTSLLHRKDDSDSITQNHLADIYVRVFGGTGTVSDGTKAVVTVLDEEIQDCLTANEGINFENKVVLSIGTRLAAEKFMIAKIDDPAFLTTIGENQTFKLFEKFRQKFPRDTQTIATLNRVLLMTPESIHLNSFMYEPILDMSDEHLRHLYQAVKDLK